MPGRPWWTLSTLNMSANPLIASMIRESTNIRDSLKTTMLPVEPDDEEQAVPGLAQQASG